MSYYNLKIPIWDFKGAVSSGAVLGEGVSSWAVWGGVSSGAVLGE